MQTHSERQRDILKKIGVEVWKVRGGDGENHSGSDDDVAADDGDVAVTQVAAKAKPMPKEKEKTKADTKPKTDDDLATIETEVAACQKCELHKSRTNTVFGCGNPTADWLFVGEAPGQNEDEQGQPFVGRAGKLLDLMIAALGMSRDEVFIANVLKCRPPQNRDPQPAEVEQCEMYLHRQLALIQPKVIVALGRISAQALLKSDAPLAKLRGQTHEYGVDNLPLIATYHPAYLLRSPGQKAKAWEDLWQAKLIVGK